MLPPAPSDNDQLPAMFKEAFDMFDGSPTVGDLITKVNSDYSIPMAERQTVLQQLAQELRGAHPSTPLKKLLPGLGGGVLGFLIAKYFRMGTVGQAVSTALGYGIGKTMGNFYQAAGDYLAGRPNPGQFKRIGYR